MSEYQYYEFKAIDKLLTADDKKAISQLSSRVKPTATSASFTYSYGDFRGDPLQVLAKYFDMMYYIANWGTQQLAFRLPKALIDRAAIEPYCVENAISLTFIGDWAILDWQFYDDDGFGWIEEGENILADLVGLRQEILQQDYRGLYLAWLKTLSSCGDNVLEFDPSQLEPPVPPGLTKLSAAQTAFTNIFEISENLVRAAASTSSKLTAISEQTLQQSIEKLSRAECDTYLLRLLQGESNLSIKLKQQLSASIATTPAISQPRRTIEQIFQAEAEESVRAEQIEQEAAIANRKQELNDLSSLESQAWEDVDTLINKAQGKTYDLAVDLLDKLRDLAADRNQFVSFQKRLDRIYETYGNRKVLIQRLKKVRLDRSN